MKKQVTIKMSEGQIDTDNKYTEIYYNVRSDYRQACQTPNPEFDPSEDEDVFGFNNKAISSSKAANQKGYFFESSHKDSNTFDRFETPTMVVFLDKTNTHKTGRATLLIETK